MGCSIGGVRPHWVWGKQLLGRASATDGTGLWWGEEEEWRGGEVRDTWVREGRRGGSGIEGEVGGCGVQSRVKGGSLECSWFSE